MVLAASIFIARDPIADWFRLHFLGQYVAGLNRVAVRDERKARLDVVSESLRRFCDENGRFPKSMSEWRQFDDRADKLLEAPPWAKGPYQVNFELLGGECARCLAIFDPGIAWPADNLPPPSDPGSRHRAGELPVGLFADGSVGGYFPFDEENTAAELQKLRGDG